jgi:plasmid replication initiation protein
MTDQLSLDFKTDSPLFGSVKNDRTMMVWNFFSLTRERQDRLPIYDDGTTRIEVKGTIDEGVANIWDKELLIYLASIMQDRINRSEPVSSEITFTVHDFLRVTGTKVAGSAYDRVEECLRRLKSTTIYTNIEVGGEGEDGGFSWINDYKVQYRRGKNGEKIMRAIWVDLGRFLFRAILKDRKMLTYDPGYFDLKPLEKRIYEIARAHCGKQNGFKMNIEKLRQRVGTTMELKHFKAELVKLSKKRNGLPAYGLSVCDPRFKRLLDVKPGTKLPGRTPLKSYLIFFYRTDRLAQMPTLEQAPLIDGDDGLPSSDNL